MFGYVCMKVSCVIWSATDIGLARGGGGGGRRYVICNIVCIKVLCFLLAQFRVFKLRHRLWNIGQKGSNSFEDHRVYRLS